MLRAGGSAFDAAVAAGFAACVAEPMFTSLGGGGFLLARPAAGRARLFDFFVETPGRGLAGPAPEPHFLPVTVHFPASDQDFNVGLGSVAVPGTLAGLLHVHERLGRLALDEVIAPARGLARDGVVVTEHQAYVLGLLVPITSRSDAGRRLWCPGGASPAPGDVIANPDLAGFLERVPREGAAALHGGELARRVERDMAAGRGLLTAEDLARYRVVEREPLAVPYRGRRLLTNPRPAPGGELLGRALRLLEATPLAELGWEAAAHWLALARAMVAVEDERAAGGTTHVSVCDAAGNAASLSLSNGEGSGYVVPGTGIMLNNMLGEEDLHPEGFHASPPGERVASMMCPSLLIEDGRVRLVVGSGGSKRIRTALLQVIRAVLDFGFDAARAVEAPRIHWDGAALQVEPGVPEAASDALAAHWPLNAWPERNLYFGGVHAVEPGAAAGGDPRRGGHGELVSR